MTRWISGAGLAAVATIAFSAFAAADNTQPPASSPPAEAAQEPPKDCTRYNGFFGFYGNVWCSPEEQARWDRWEADRLRATTGAGTASQL